MPFLAIVSLLARKIAHNGGRLNIGGGRRVATDGAGHPPAVSALHHQSCPGWEARSWPAPAAADDPPVPIT